MIFFFLLNEWGVFEPFSRLALYFQGHEETNSYKPIAVPLRQSSVLSVFGGEETLCFDDEGNQDAFLSYSVNIVAPLWRVWGYSRPAASSILNHRLVD